jgi:hypothetical protein
VTDVLTLSTRASDFASDDQAADRDVASCLST